jgi:hypothetical protein
MIDVLTMLLSQLYGDMKLPTRNHLNGLAVKTVIRPIVVWSRDGQSEQLSR